LLVVIGIIALLISILLPALQSARRQANTVKCEAHLRELGHAFQLYSVENKGWSPVVQHDNYVVGGLTSPGTGNFAAFWWNFIEKYYNKGRKLGITSTTNEEGGQARASLIWGCPAWDGFATGTLGTMNRNMPGYGMNWEAKTTPQYPAPLGLTTGAQRAIKVSWNPKGQFFRTSQWTKPSERCLLADSKFYSIEQLPAPLTATELPGEGSNLAATWSAASPLPGENTFMSYRHGKYPSVLPGTTRFSTKGGKVGANILYWDGHVSTAMSRVEMYKSIRMRFPG
jgi:prepilin-type processing-associated H-X9-DG protein